MIIDLAHAAQALLDTRRTRRWLDDLPEGGRPRSEADAYAIQDLVARSLGPIVGWKVGSATLQSEPFRAAIHGDMLFNDTDPNAAPVCHDIGTEEESAYNFAYDLSERALYSRAAVLDAVAAMRPAIEIVDTSYDRLTPSTHLACSAGN
jgi:2-keto-4-pentenoate hydratase